LLTIKVLRWLSELENISVSKLEKSTKKSKMIIINEIKDLIMNLRDNRTGECNLYLMVAIL
jgi:hypothetical protein